MTKFVVVAVPDGYVVAYRNWRGHLCAVSNHIARQSAIEEAAERNRVAADEAARSARRQWLPPRQRRPVRWFDDDKFA